MSTDNKCIITLPRQVKFPDGPPYYVVARGLATGVYPISQWPSVELLVRSKQAAVISPGPWWRKCEKWNQAIHAVNNATLLDSSFFDDSILQQLPPRHIMAPEYWDGLWPEQATILIDLDDARHTMPWIGEEIVSSVRFAVRGAQSSPLRATRSFIGEPIKLLVPPQAIPLRTPSPRAAITADPAPQATRGVVRRQQRRRESRLNLLPESLTLPVHPSRSQSQSQNSPKLASSWARSQPDYGESGPTQSTSTALAPPPPTLVEDSDDDYDRSQEIAREWDRNEISTAIIISSPRAVVVSLNPSPVHTPNPSDAPSPELFPLSTQALSSAARQLEVIQRGRERIQAMANQRTSDPVLEAEINASVIVHLIESCFVTCEGMNAIRRAVERMG
ncbi:hypothetical protein RSOL_504140, partial [Rhizoctonia solani AG-3 Rhs1AP]